jgi:hypothetical protein
MWVEEKHHVGIALFLDKQWFDKEHNALIRNPKGSQPKIIVRELKAFLKEDLGKAEHCNRCGGLVPELVLRFEGKQYWFTCHEILDSKDQLIMGTNYEVLRLALNKEEKRKSLP